MAMALDAPGMGLTMSNLGLGLGMGMTASALGMSGGVGGSSTGKIDEAERRRRLEMVLATLATRPGKISEEGIKMLAKRLGLDTAEEGGGAAGERILALAGNTTIWVGVGFGARNPQNVESVHLQYMGLSDVHTNDAKKAEKILLNDLNPSGIDSINTSLVDFANNLERLARMDKLSRPGANCFEAIAGVYNALKRVYEHEKSTAETLLADKQDIDFQVMLKASGMPKMHTRKRVGLSIDYWIDNHVVLPAETYDQPDEMQRVYSMVLECEHSPPVLYPSMRVSNDWLTTPQRKLEDIDNTTMIDADSLSLNHEVPFQWQDLPSPDPLSLDPATPPSQARFVAQFEPPIALPLALALALYESVGIDASTDLISTTWDELVLPSSTTPQQRTELRPRSIERTRLVPLGDASREWSLALHIPTPQLACTISTIPFTHPKQLAPLLPTLRQYAFLTHLLRSSFPCTPASASPSKTTTTLDDLLGTTTPARHVAVTFTLQPSPSLSIVLPGPTTRRLKVDVLPNAELLVQSEGFAGGDDQMRNKACARALSVCEDVGVWAEWMRGRYP